MAIDILCLFLKDFACYKNWYNLKQLQIQLKFAQCRTPKLRIIGKNVCHIKNYQKMFYFYTSLYHFITVLIEKKQWCTLQKNFYN